MARWENEDLSGLNIPEPAKVTETFYGKGADVAEPKVAFAKIIAHGDRETYYVKSGRGYLLDPYHVDRLTHNRSFFDFKKVNKNIFDLYMEYLKSTSRIFLTRARRLMMEN